MQKTLLFILLICFSTYYSLSQSNSKTIIYFDNNEAQLTEVGKAALKTSILSIKGMAIENIVIIGYANNIGKSEYNQLLSKKRATNTRDYLVLQGIHEALISVEAMGENNSTQTPVNNSVSSDRRVEVIFSFLKKEENTTTKEKTLSTPPLKPERLTIPRGFILPFQQFNITPQKVNQIKLDSKGTILHIPANSFIDETGNPVTDNVLISYREYKNAADIAFSDIPMTYQVGSKQLFFNSAGMFEIQGTTLDKKSIQVAPDKALSIDYALAKNIEDIDFYELEDSNWTEVQPIQSQPTIVTEYDTSYAPRLAWDGWSRRKLADNKLNEGQITVDVSISGGDSIVVLKVKGEKVAEGVWRNGKFEGKILKKKWQNDKGKDLVQTMLDMKIPVMIISPRRLEQYDNIVNESIVKDLPIEDFGIYNCDQIYQIPNLVMIDANYVDENGTPINSPYKLSVIDLKYNSAFSFEPLHFYFGKKSKTVLALFNRMGEIYLLESKDLEDMNIKKSGRYTFKMKNMTETIKNTADLAAYLGL